MDRRVETFLQVAENGSFSETARKLFISQPAVTQQIASLGDELGVRLFERDGNRMVLTTPGRVAQAHYQRMLDYLKPDFVHVLVKGRIVKDGTASLGYEIEDKGFDWIVNSLTEEA